MAENGLLTRYATCGTGLVLAAVFLFAHLPAIALLVPVAILLLGILAGPDETRAIWCGMLSVLCIFEISAPGTGERENCAAHRHSFWSGEAGMAAMLAGIFAVPSGCWLAGRTEPALALIGAAVVFLPLFVFLPKALRWAAKADMDAAIGAIGKNEQVKKVFWAVFAAMAGLLLARVVDPATARQIAGVITAMGG